MHRHFTLCKPSVLTGCLFVARIYNNLGSSQDDDIIEAENISTTTELMMECSYNTNRLTSSCGLIRGDSASRSRMGGNDT